MPARLSQTLTFGCMLVYIHIARYCSLHVFELTGSGAGLIVGVQPLLRLIFWLNGDVYMEVYVCARHGD